MPFDRPALAAALKFAFAVPLSSEVVLLEQVAMKL